MQQVKFKIFKGADNLYYFRLNAMNGEALLQSEGYLTRSVCQIVIESVKTNAPFDIRYDRNASNNQAYFFLKAANGVVIGRSEMCRTEANMTNIIRAVRRDAPNALVEDIT